MNNLDKIMDCSCICHNQTERLNSLDALFIVNYLLYLSVGKLANTTAVSVII